MDIEEYLRQKRALESKKEVLEAKTKLKETKDSVKKEKLKEARIERLPENRGYREPALKPWMIWDLIILMIVIALFSVSYFAPRYDNDIVKNNVITGQAVAAQPTQTQTTQQTETQENTEETSNAANTDSVGGVSEETSTLPGPEFSMILKDKTLGEFDDEGKLNGEILVIETESGYYKDGIITVQNEEQVPIKCDVEKDIELDVNMDNEYEARDMGKLFTVELDGAQKKDIKITIPGDLETGNYYGQGRVLAKFTSACFFCKDDDCETWESKGKSEEFATMKVVINPNGGGSGNFGNNSGNNTNSSG